MKYYIPTSSLNFNNILSTESLSPKSFYEKRGFGYSRWFSVEENCIAHLTLLYGTPHMFNRPESDIEDHPMLIEIDTDEEFPEVVEGVYYTDRTIYLNPWQTKFIFFSEKDKTIAMSMSDSSLETKLVRLYQRKIYVHQFDGIYPIIQKDSITPVSDIDSLIEEDYIINKMKGLLYGYYIGANLSSSKEDVRKLDTLREMLNIFSSVLSSYDKVPSNIQRSRLNELFDYLDSQQPIYSDLEKEVGNRQLVDRIFSVFKRHGYVFTGIDRSELIHGLQYDSENNKSVIWVNREIERTKDLMASSRIMLNPDDAEIIVSSKDMVTAPKVISDNLMSDLFVCWVNDVLCSKAFNGKINSIKEILSDEITKSAKNVIGAEWDNSPIRSYLNQLRRHVRGEEFNQTWDNGVLSSISAVLIKGDEWEQLLNFMQNKGMNDYRIAFAMYGVLNGFANMTLEKSIPETSATAPVDELKKSENTFIDYRNRTIILQNPEEKVLIEWQNEIREFAASIIKKDKQKLLKSLEDALLQNGTNQDYFVFITMLDNFKGWKPGKNGPSAVWKRMQEHYVPDYDQRIGKPAKRHITEQKTTKSDRTLFDGIVDGIQHTAQTVMSVLSGKDNIEEKPNEKTNDKSQEKKIMPVSRIGRSILEDRTWIQECASLIYDNRAYNQFLEDMEWFVANHNDIYNDKKKGAIPGYYAGHDRTNMRVLERLKAYMENKLKPRNPQMQWLANIYVKIPIGRIVNYISNVYGN